jgi:glycosyltransferase involved in cell wall biosynthesis
MTGSYGYWPNEDAALRLIAMSRSLHARGVLRRLELVGISPTPAMLAAARGLGHVVVTGRVPEVRPHLERASVVAAPISAGSGTRLKILEALALARPVLTTPVGAEGLDLEPGVHAEISDLPGFPARLASLLEDPARRAAHGKAGRAWAEQRYSFAAMGERVRELLQGAER